MSVVLNRLPDNRFHVWDISELYFGTTPTKEVYRPNVNDMVIDRTVGIYFVTEVSDEGIPTLEMVSRFSQQSTFNLESTSLITALSHYQPSAVNRAYFSDDTSPYTIEIDGRFRVFGSAATKMVFFRGTDVSSTGTVISETRNSNGDLTGNDIALEEITPGVDTVKRPNAFHTSTALKGGEVITGVVYTAAGGVYSTQPFLLTENSAIRASDAADNFINGISIKSPLLSATDDTLIENTVGSPFNTTLITGVLHYSDGSTQEVNVDGTKMVLHGYRSFDTSRVGRPHNVVLTYYPGANEPFINGGIGSKNHISKAYKLANVVTDNAYKLKVFLIPTYDATTGYSFKWMMVNLDGDLYTDVTNNVTAKVSNSSDVSGTDYGTLQNVTLSVDMDAVAPSLFPGYIHTQTFNLTVAQPGTIGFAPWLIDYVGDNNNPYGRDVIAATDSAGSKITVNFDAKKKEDWLNRAYYAVEPLFDSSTQTEAAEPTHFIIEYLNGASAKISVDDWNTAIARPSGLSAFTDNSTVTLRWILETSQGDKVLGYTPMLVKAHL